MESNYLIERRNAACFGNKRPEVKKVYQIPKRSDKMKAEIKKVIPEYKKFLSTHPNCEIKFKRCLGKAIVVHHAAGRIGEKLHDQSDWIASCVNCNLDVEINDLEARSKGVKKSKHIKAETTLKT